MCNGLIQEINKYVNEEENIIVLIMKYDKYPCSFDSVIPYSRETSGWGKIVVEDGVEILTYVFFVSFERMLLMWF